MGLLDGLIGGIGNLFSSGAGALGKGVGAIGGGLSSLFHSFGNGASSAFNGIGNSAAGQGANSLGGQVASQAANSATSSAGNAGASGLSNLFGKSSAIPLGLATMFGSQAIGNPKLPELPDSFKLFQQQANAGGPPIQQQSNQYMQGILNGTNTGAQDAATHSMDLNYQEQLRQLNGMYKSLRPGTDPTSDTTYQRDLSNLNDQYTRQRAQVLSQQQQGAAQYGLQSGAEQSNQQLAGIETQVSQLAAQYNLDAQQKTNLRNMLMQMGGNLSMLGGISQLFPNALGNGGKT